MADDSPELATATGPAATASSEAEFDIFATYNRLLAEDPDLTKPVAAIEALIDVLRHTSSSTAMETYEIAAEQVARLHAAVPNALPIEAGTSLFTKFLSMSMRQPAYDALATPAAPAAQTDPNSSFMSASSVLTPPTADLDNFDKIRQHLLDNSQLFVQRAKDARHRIAEHGCRLVRRGDVVLTAGASRAVTALFIKAAEQLGGNTGEGSNSTDGDDSDDPPFTVLYVCDERARNASERAMAQLRAHGIAVHPLDPSAVAYALEMHQTASVFVGSEAVTHDGKLVSRMGTAQLAQLAQLVARPPRKVYALAETHKFVHKLVLNNRDLGRIGIRQSFLSASVASRRTKGAEKPALAFEDQVDMTPPSLITSIITENGIMQPSASYFILM